VPAESPDKIITRSTRLMRSTSDGLVLTV